MGLYTKDGSSFLIVEVRTCEREEEGGMERISDRSSGLFPLEEERSQRDVKTTTYR